MKKKGGTMDICNIFEPGGYGKSSDEYTVEEAMKFHSLTEEEELVERLDSWLNHGCDAFPRMRRFMSEQPEHILEVPTRLAREIVQANQIPREFMVELFKRK